MADFKESKKAGDVGEEEVLKIVLKKHPDAFIDNTGKANSKWDVYIPSHKYGIEVKNDYKSKHTGNLVIEVEFDDRLSALSVTESKYWVFITGYHYVWITPLEIYRFLEQHFEYGRARFKAKGDSKYKRAYLVRLDVFIEHIKKSLSREKKTGWIVEIKENEVMYYDNFTKHFTPDDEVGIENIE